MNAEAKVLRKFSVTMFCACCVVGLLVLWRKGEAGYIIGGIGLILLIGGILRPRVLRIPYRVWMALAALLGFLMSHFVLLLVYYLVFTPTGIIMKIIGRDALCRKIEKRGETYWIRKKHEVYVKERYEKMF